MAQAQADKRLVQADQYFAAGEYYTAAHLYDQFLHPVKKQISPSNFPLNSKRSSEGNLGSYGTKFNVVYKQAESYRLANYWTQASALYQECFQKDSVQYASALYWYAVCQRNLGNYSVAEESLNRFISNNITDASIQQGVAKEKSILQFIKSQLQRPDSVLYHVQKMETSYGNEKGVYAPVATGENTFLFTSTQTDSITTPGVNPNHNRLFQSVSTGGEWQNLTPVFIENMNTGLNQGAASISPNGNVLYFTQWTKEKGKSVSSIYYANKKDSGWSQPILLSTVNKEGANSQQPFCSADGKYLFFASDRAGGAGNFDIWVAAINEDGTTAEPLNAGPQINTVDNEQAPFYHISSNTLVFASDRAPGMGGYDLFAAKSVEMNWKPAENMGYPVNSSRDDIYFFAPSNKDLLNNALVSSDRGSECCLATYTVSKTPKKKMITGVVKDCKDNEPVADAEVTMKDPAGKSFTTKTGIDGKYVFELGGEANKNVVAVQKDKYNEKSADVTIEGINEAEWHTDTLYNAPLCIEKKLVIKVENVVTIFFDFDQSKLKDRGVEQLDSIYNVLIENPTATIQISGYTDGRGSVEYNKKLSDKRAKACADYLVQKGIDEARISFESFGSCCPVEMELINGRDNPNARSANRRALINISKE